MQAPVLRGKISERWLMSQLKLAYDQAKRHKRGTKDENDFEMFWLQNLQSLMNDILDGCYKPSRGIAFISHNPVDREIFAAPFRDRIVHHFLCAQIEQWLDRRFIDSSFSCRKGKGTRYGIIKCQRDMRKVSQGGRKKAYIIKLDIQGYFMSLSRQGLYKRVLWALKRMFPNGGRRFKLYRYLWAEVIFDDPVRGVRKRPPFTDWDKIPVAKTLFTQPPGKGIVIGNLTSQTLSNLYLSLLDRFVTMVLGYKYYGRYVDDFYIMVPEEQFEQAKRDIEVIRKFLLGIGLVLHPKKRYIQPVERGVDFLGVWIHLRHITPSKRFRRHFMNAAREVVLGRRKPESIVSYLGYCMDTEISADRFCRHVFKVMGWADDIEPEQFAQMTARDLQRYFQNGM